MSPWGFSSLNPFFIREVLSRAERYGSLRVSVMSQSLLHQGSSVTVLPGPCWATAEPSQSLLHQGSSVTWMSSTHSGSVGSGLNPFFIREVLSLRAAVDALPGDVACLNPFFIREVLSREIFETAVDKALESQSLLHQGSSVTRVASPGRGPGSLLSQSLLHQGSSVTGYIVSWGEEGYHCLNPFFIREVLSPTQPAADAARERSVSIPSSSGKFCHRIENTKPMPF